MQKSIWLIFIVGGGSIALLAYLSTNMLQSSPQFRRFFQIRNTIATEVGIPEGAIRLSGGPGGGVSGIRFRVEEFEPVTQEMLEDLAGLVFELEVKLRKEDPKSQKTYFREVIFEGWGPSDMKLNRVTYKDRKRIREAVGLQGGLRIDLAEELGAEPGTLDLRLVEDPGRQGSSRLGVVLRQVAREPSKGLPEEAVRAGRVVYGHLENKIYFFRYVREEPEGERSWTADAASYFNERRRARSLDGMDWGRVLKPSE